MGILYTLIDEAALSANTRPWNFKHIVNVQRIVEIIP